MPEQTLHALAAYDAPLIPMPQDGYDAEAVLGDFAKAGIDVDALAAQLQQEGAEAFSTSWNELLAMIDSKSHAAGRSL